MKNKTIPMFIAEEVAEIYKESPLLSKPYYKVEGPNWTVDGDIWDREYKIRRNMNVIADISIVMPSRTENFAVITEILVGESVLVGRVPDAYLQSDIFGNKLPLSPN